MPELVELADRFEGRADVLLVSIDLALPVEHETPEAVIAFARAEAIDLPILVYDGEILPLMERLALPGGVPQTLAITTDGEVVDTQSGQADLQRFEQMIEAALGGS